MYILGYVVYLLVAFSCFKIKFINDYINEGISLAPEIVFGMLFFLSLPLFVFTYHVFKKKKDERSKNALEKFSKLASSVSVSLGLIGTFIGLTQMVTAIASSMMGTGDLTERMSMMLGSISGALSSMSYAFLTSIIGVTVSVIINISFLFFTYFYSKSNNECIDELNRVNAKCGDFEYVAAMLNKSHHDCCEYYHQSNAKMGKICELLLDSYKLRKEELVLVNNIESILKHIESSNREHSFEINKSIDGLVETIKNVDSDIKSIHVENDKMKKKIGMLPEILSTLVNMKLSLDKIMSIFNFKR